MLPGYTRKLPGAAQQLVEKALLDKDLVDAPAHDERWVKLYDDLQRLVKEAPTSSTSSNNDQANEDEDDDSSSYQWASSPDEEPSTIASPSRFVSNPHSQAHHTSHLPHDALSTAVHRRISHRLTNKTRALPKSVLPASWDPASLTALSMLVEELARSQAHFNAQRTMFAKSPRNQALAAKRAALKGKGKDTGEEAPSAPAESASD